MPHIIGVTGSIGTGKSTVLRMLERLGARTLSADDISREVMAVGTPAYCEVVERFGETILSADGSIDRPELAEVIFADDQARRDLEEITHPRIIGQIKDEIEKFRKSSPSSQAVLAVEIPLLIECGLEGIVDEVLLVAAEQQTQVDRLTSRSGISRDEALRRIGAQMPISEKIAHADRVIWNDGSLETLEQSVRLVWQEILLP
ncbi:MAG: dephospho-CoA kinase [Armatimonadota bacterium]|nr:dephospho-CoA kinase [bacterium]